MPDPSTRARDSDRDRAVAQLDEAYVDGQLSDAERSLRVSQALAARTIGDLDGLVEDLQGAGSPATIGRRRTIAVIVAATGATVLIAVVGAITALSGGDGDDRAAVAEPVEIQQPSSAPTAEPTVEQSEEPEPETAAKPLTRQYFEDFRDAYRKRFGDTLIYDAMYFEDGNVSFSRQLSRARRDLLQDWDWYAATGFEKSISPPAPNVWEYEPLDLSSVDYQKLVRHVVQGRKHLGVTQPGRSVRVSMPLDAEYEEQLIEVSVTNEYSDRGWRYVTLDGTLVESHPFVVGDQ
ncbi:DUF1707 SHOCT-like domain-containing protein [Solicola gregarius]|uniref:DUF1707 domain-containing protein n=1 Tax=Solicola gregarius TaxID=2908642 RepID=A0AA46TGC3_9ACTN|nr:DUF1707 domain-containing protein [Solicola gregarius]UYM04852.1 DUF1707 domain-containing protein [Solicola gregarius]